MGLPDLGRSLRRFAESPVLDNTNGAAVGKVTFHTYASPLAAAVLLTAGHFNFARDQLVAGDVIFAVAAAESAPDLLILRVGSVPAAPGNVTVIADEPAAAASEARTIDIALAASATTDGMDITITVQDANGAAIAAVHELEWWISESAVGAGLTADTYSGDVTTGTGTELQEIVAKKHYKGLTDANGVLVATAVDSANPADQYVAVRHPVTGQVIVSAVSGTNWEGA